MGEKPAEHRPCAAAEEMKEAGAAGIYIHVPFCLRKCPYCDFYSATEPGLVDDWADALMNEMEMAAGGNADTIYFGGGTPSILDERKVERILEAAGKRFDVSSDVEMTFEVNPGTVSADKLRNLRDAGINRLNIGVQSFSDKSLSFLRRIHSAGQATAALEQARKAGFSNIGLDLIYAIPGQTRAGWERELAAALSFSPEHISCYQLTYADNTPMAEALARGEFEAMGDKAGSDLFLLADELLTARGYLHYEISSYSKTPSLKSRHNQKYWHGAPYLGLGPAAHSFCSGRRWWNMASVREYIEALQSGRSPIMQIEDLDCEQEMIEAVYLGLRCAEGLDCQMFSDRFGIDCGERFRGLLERYQGEGYLAVSEDAVVLTAPGMLYADAIAAAFVDLL